MVASGGGLSEGYGHGGPGVCLGDGQTEAKGVPLQGGRGDALLRRMPPYMTCHQLGKISKMTPQRHSQKEHPKNG